MDAEIMLGILKKDGFEITNHKRDADILIINTCSFIKEATQESFKTISGVLKRKKEKPKNYPYRMSCPERKGDSFKKISKD